MKNSKVAHRKENGGQILLKLRLSDSENSKDEIWENGDYLKIRFRERYLQNEIWENIFKNK